MDPVVSLFLNLSAGTAFLHVFTIHPWYLKSCAINWKHMCSVGPSRPRHCDRSGHKICALQIVELNWRCTARKAQIPLGSLRHVSTRHVYIIYFYLFHLTWTNRICVCWTRSTRRTCRVETWRAKWNLGLIHRQSGVFMSMATWRHWRCVTTVVRWYSAAPTALYSRMWSSTSTAIQTGRRSYRTCPRATSRRVPGDLQRRPLQRAPGIRLLRTALYCRVLRKTCSSERICAVISSNLCC